MTDDQNGKLTTAGNDELEEVGEESDPGTALQEENAMVLAAIPGGLQIFQAMLEQVPEPEADAAARIVLQILEAQSLQDLDSPWDVEGMKNHVDAMLVVKEITRMPSDFVGGLGWYLVCTVEEPGSDEKWTVTTGAVSIVAQLVRAHVAGWLPLTVTVRRSAKPTKRGFHPMHLEVVRTARRARAVVIDQAPAEPTRQEQSRQRRQDRIRSEVAQGATQAGE